MTMQDQKIAIIGGGLSGLSAAHHLLELTNGACQLTLYEAADRIGGVIATQQRDGCLLDLGADSFITNKPAAIELCKRLGIEDQLQSTDKTYRGALILHEGKPCPVPAGFQLLLPTNIQAVLDSPLLSDSGKQRFLAEEQVPPRVDGAEESLTEFVTRRFGEEVHERLVQPLIGGIYTADPDRLSIQATLPRFPAMERQYGSLIAAAAATKKEQTSDSGARYELFMGLRNGMGTLLRALADRVAASARMQLGSPIQSVTQQDSAWSITTSVESTTFDAVIIATPTWSAANLLRDCDADLAKRLDAIEYASSAIVLSLHDLKSIQHPLDSFGLVIPRRENRQILAVSFSSRKFPNRVPEGKVLCRTFVGGATQAELLQHSDSELVALVQKELADIFGITEAADWSQVARWNRAMPQYLVGHQNRVRAIRERLANHAGLSLASNAYDGVGIPDAIASGEAAAAATLDHFRSAE